MSGHTQMIVSIKKNFDVYLQAKNQFHLSRFPWDIARTLQTCYFGYFGNEGLRTPNVIPSIRRIFWYLFLGKKLTLFPTFLGATARICKLLTLGTLGMPGYAHPKWWYYIVESFNFYPPKKYRKPYFGAILSLFGLNFGEN